MPIEHKNITDPDIHEPKGIAAAVANKIYVSDGAASGDWRFHPHSALYYDNIGTGTTITTPTSYTLVGPVTTADVAPHDFTHNGLGRLTYTGTDIIDLHLMCTITMKHSAGSGQDLFFQLHKNGSPLSGSQIVRTADSANYGNANILAHTSAVTTNDYFELYCKVSSGNIIVHAFSLIAIGQI